MNKEYFTDNISDETLAQLIDETLRLEKNNKDRNISVNLLKIIPVVAMIALVIGLVNVLPVFLNVSNDVDPNSSINGGVGTLTDIAITSEPYEQFELFLPDAIEKYFYEDKILANITDQRAVNTMNSYYWLDGSVYKLDPNITGRERKEILGYFREYTDLTYGDMFNMCMDYGIPLPKNVDPAYAHIRFGDDVNNTLLLDIEWYTYDTYMERAEQSQKWFYEYIESDEFMELPDEDRERIIYNQNEYYKREEEYANRIKDEDFYLARTINGKSGADWLIYNKNIVSGDPHITGVNSDGYYIFQIFPINCVYVYYYDENGEWKQKNFTNGYSNGCPIWIESQSEYENLLNKKIIPFCDDLLAKGLLQQWDYDKFTIPNLLEYYIDLYFN